MREIEIKARLKDSQKIIGAITKRGVKITEQITQHDRVYGMATGAGGSSHGRPWLRIRTETKGGVTKHYFTLKKSITGQLDSIEHETEIIDDEELAKIIAYIGFTPYSDLTKTRRKAKVGDIEVCIDHIESLGNFVEAEMLTPEDVDHDAVVGELWGLLESVGVEKANQVTDGYDVLMNKHLGHE